MLASRKFHPVENSEISCRKNPTCCFVLGVVGTLLHVVIYFALVFYTSHRKGGTTSEFAWLPPASRNLSSYVDPVRDTALISNRDLCLNNTSDVTDSDVFLLVVVCSSPGNFKARSAIRETWGSFPTSPVDFGFNTTSEKVRLAFLVGRSPGRDDLDEKVKTESRTHGDIIMEDFHDSYMNLTIKSVAMLKWVAYHCRQVKFVMKTDDDMFVNVPALVRYLRHERQNPQRLIAGSLFCYSRPITNPSSKWYVPRFMFSESVYPRYVSGTGYVISGPLVPAMLTAALQEPLFHLEDVFLTGIVARKIGVTPENDPRFTYYKYPMKQLCHYRQLITSHHLSARELKIAWNSVQNPRLNCSAVEKAKFEKSFRHCPSKVNSRGSRKTISFKHKGSRK